MVLRHPFFVPTRVIEGKEFDQALRELLGGRRWSLITSPGWRTHGTVARVNSVCGEPVHVFTEVTENPTVSTITRVAGYLTDVEVVVALGGGSVIDAVKGAVALVALNGNMDLFLDHLREGLALPESLAPEPIIAIPTTSGTGSEVTRWGTIWGEDGIKHSVMHNNLAPRHAIIDPALTVSMSRDLTIATALDALSHSMESVWNKRHSALTDAIATQAIRLLRENLNTVLLAPNNIVLRRRIQTAALLAGLAMGTTQTALAHSISYPFTSRYGVPHGLACSFTLPEVAQFNMKTKPSRLAPIADGLACTSAEVPKVLEAWFESLDLATMLFSYVSPEAIDELGDNEVTRARAANNIREIDGSAARDLARRALYRLFETTKKKTNRQPLELASF